MSLKSISLVAALLQYASAQQQQSRIVPQDLQTGFQGGAVEIQVSYENRAIDGFRDGTQFEKNAVAKEPTFALGDSSGISPTLLQTIIMVDTTCANKRTLHYARANFKNNFDITNIATDSAPLQAYKAPGSFGEKGDNRQYSFLMYVNPNREPIENLKLPAEGEAFDVKKFQSDNNLPDPQAGVGMIVKLGGQADCGGDQANTLPATSSTARASTTTARTSNVNAGPTSNAGSGSGSTSGSGSGSGSVATSNTASGPTSTTAAGARSTTVTQRPSTPTPSSAASQSPNNENENTPASSARRPSAPSAAPSAAQSDAEAPNEAPTTLARSSQRPAGSPTVSGSVVQQTTNAAPGVPSQAMGWLAPIFVAAGVLVW